MAECIVCGSITDVRSIITYPICLHCIEVVFDRCNVENNSERLAKELELALHMYKKGKLSPKDLSFILSKTVGGQVFGDRIEKYIPEKEC